MVSYFHRNSNPETQRPIEAIFSGRRFVKGFRSMETSYFWVLTIRFSGFAITLSSIFKDFILSPAHLPRRYSISVLLLQMNPYSQIYSIGLYCFDNGSLKYFLLSVFQWASRWFFFEPIVFELCRSFVKGLWIVLQPQVHSRMPEKLRDSLLTQATYDVSMSMPLVPIV